MIILVRLLLMFVVASPVISFFVLIVYGKDTDVSKPIVQGLIKLSYFITISALILSFFVE